MINEEIVIEKDQVNMNLEDKCREYLEIKLDLSAENAQLKAIKEEIPQFAEMEELRKRLKELKGEIDNNSEYLSVKEIVDEMKSKKEVVEMWILKLMRQKQQGLFDYQDHAFQVNEKLKCINKK